MCRPWIEGASRKRRGSLLLEATNTSKASRFDCCCRTGEAVCCAASPVPCDGFGPMVFGRNQAVSCRSISAES
jgi:hypothetical protein